MDYTVKRANIVSLHTIAFLYKPRLVIKTAKDWHNMFILCDIWYSIVLLLLLAKYGVINMVYTLYSNRSLL